VKKALREVESFPCRKGRGRRALNSTTKPQSSRCHSSSPPTFFTPSLPLFVLVLEKKKVRKEGGSPRGGALPCPRRGGKKKTGRDGEERSGPSLERKGTDGRGGVHLFSLCRLMGRRLLFFPSGEKALLPEAGGILGRGKKKGQPASPRTEKRE